MQVDVAIWQNSRGRSYISGVKSVSDFCQHELPSMVYWYLIVSASMHAPRRVLTIYQTSKQIEGVVEALGA